MPVRFFCPTCNKLLSVTKRKIGTEVNCPKCSAPMIVPSPDEADEEDTAIFGGGATSGSQPATRESAGYDDVTEAIGGPPVTRRRKQEPIGDDADYIAVPRRWLYLQAGLFAVVAIVAYFLGNRLSQRGAAPVESAAAVETISFTFDITYEEENKELPDEGAVVLAWPADKLPSVAERLPGVELAPERAAPTEGTLQTLKSWGGAFARADSSGHARITVTKAEKYRVLAVSRRAVRLGKAKVDSVDMSLFEKIFTEAGKLVGDHAYLLKRMELIAGGKQALRFASGK